MGRIKEAVKAGVQAFVREVHKTKFDAEGRELPDPTPLEVPAGQRRPETIQQMMQRLIRQDVSRAAQEHGAESFEEANDFDVDDDDMEVRATHHELHEEVVGEALRVRQEARDEASRRSVRGEEGASGEEGSEEGEAARSTARAGVSSKVGKVKERARRSRPSSDDEDAPEVDRRRGRTGRVEVEEDDS